MHRLHGRQILLGDILDMTAALLHITDDATDDTLICIGFHIDFNIEKGTKLRIFEDEDALDDDDSARSKLGRLLRTVMLGIVIHRTLYALAAPQRLQMCDEKIRFERIRVIVVHLLTHFKRDAIVRLIVIIVIYHGDLVTEFLLKTIRKGRLAGA